MGCTLMVRKMLVGLKENPKRNSCWCSVKKRDFTERFVVLLCMHIKHLKELQLEFILNHSPEKVSFSFPPPIYALGSQKPVGNGDIAFQVLCNRQGKCCTTKDMHFI